MNTTKDRIARDEEVSARIKDLMLKHPDLEEYEARYRARSEICLKGAAPMNAETEHVKEF